MTEQREHPDYTDDESQMLAALREVEPVDSARELPPADLWASIERAVATAGGGAPSGPEQLDHRKLTDDDLADDDLADEADLADVTDLADHVHLTSIAVKAGGHRRLALWLSAVAVLVVALVAGVVVSTRGRSETIVAETKLSSAGLTGAPAGLQGDAEVLKSRQGEVIRVDIGNLRPASGEFLEVWLIKPDISGMVSLGTVRTDGTYDVPAGLRITDYPIVDVSTEPYDGNPAHSGASLLRGVLKT